MTYLIDRGNGVYSTAVRQMVTNCYDERFPTFELEDGSVFGTTWEKVTKLPEVADEDQSDV